MQRREIEVYSSLNIFVANKVSAVFAGDVAGAAKSFSDRTRSLLYRPKRITREQIPHRLISLVMQRLRYSNQVHPCV